MSTMKNQNTEQGAEQRVPVFHLEQSWAQLESLGELFTPAIPIQKVCPEPKLEMGECTWEHENAT